MRGARHEFYETDEKLTLSIFDRNADPAQVSIQFEPRKVYMSIFNQLDQVLNDLLDCSSPTPMATSPSSSNL